MKNIRQALPQISSQDLIMNTVTIQILAISGFQLVNFSRENLDQCGLNRGGLSRGWYGSIVCGLFGVTYSNVSK